MTITLLKSADSHQSLFIKSYSSNQTIVVSGVVVSTINNRDTLIHNNIANCSIAVLKREQFFRFLFTNSHTDFYISLGTDHYKFGGDGRHGLN